MATQKGKRNTKAGERADVPPVHRRPNTYLWIAVVGLGGLVAGLVLSNRGDREYEAGSYRAGSRNVIAAPAMNPNDPMYPLVQDVARHFLCGCRQCGDMPLVECVCGMSNGGVAEKNFIRDQLAAGYPPAGRTISARNRTLAGQSRLLRFARNDTPPEMENLCASFAISASLRLVLYRALHPYYYLSKSSKAARIRGAPSSQALRNQ